MFVWWRKKLKTDLFSLKKNHLISLCNFEQQKRICQSWTEESLLIRALEHEIDLCKKKKNQNQGTLNLAEKFSILEETSFVLVVRNNTMALRLNIHSTENQTLKPKKERKKFQFHCKSKNGNGNFMPTSRSTNFNAEPKMQPLILWFWLEGDRRKQYGASWIESMLTPNTMPKL